MPAEALVKAMETCLRIGSVSTDLVAIEARKAMEGTDDEDAELLTGDGPAHDAGGESAGQEAAGARVISLHARRLPPDARTTLPDMSKYDRLLNPVTTRESSQNQKGQGA